MAQQANAGVTQTLEFRHFIRYFFKDELYQKAHVKFPLEVVTLTYSEELNDIVPASKFISEQDWKAYKGPDYYQCQTDCYDLIIYDNFEKTQRESSERVLSFEGVNNGINSSLYFKNFNGQWYLVKYEEFDT